jgi:hypothetical protein
MHDQYHEDLGWPDPLTGTQTQASQPGAASLASFFASPLPPLDLIAKQGRDQVQIQGSATNTHNQAAQD